MKTVVIFFGSLSLFLAIVAAEEEKKCPVKVALEQGIDKCIDELNPSEDTLDSVMKEEGQDREDVQCFQACLMNKAGLMNGAKFDFDKLEEVMRSVDEPDEDEITKVTNLLKDCKDTAEVSDNQCEVAGAYVKCVKDQVDAEK